MYRQNRQPPKNQIAEYCARLRQEIQDPLRVTTSDKNLHLLTGNNASRPDTKRSTIPATA